MEPPGKRLILVVDDNEAIRSLVSTILGMQDMEVVTAANGEEALEFINRRRPDLMLLDLSMPHIDGVEVLRRVRAHPHLKDLRVVMLTAVAQVGRFHELNAYRPDGFVEKPFRVNDLVDRVKQALNRNPVS